MVVKGKRQRGGAGNGDQGSKKVPMESLKNRADIQALGDGELNVENGQTLFRRLFAFLGAGKRPKQPLLLGGASRGMELNFRAQFLRCSSKEFLQKRSRL
jgi:hypothetical protein